MQQEPVADSNQSPVQDVQQSQLEELKQIAFDLDALRFDSERSRGVNRTEVILIGAVVAMACAAAYALYWFATVDTANSIYTSTEIKESVMFSKVVVAFAICWPIATLVVTMVELLRRDPV